MLPFGSVISYVIFEEISSLVHLPLSTVLMTTYWAIDTRQFVGKQPTKCNKQHKKKGLPLLPEKLVSPTKYLSFLSLGIDTVKWVIVVPEDKNGPVKGRGGLS